jgi:hypothetical protein
LTSRTLRSHAQERNRVPVPAIACRVGPSVSHPPSSLKLARVSLRRGPARRTESCRYSRVRSASLSAQAPWITLTDLWAHLSVSPATTSSPMAELRRKLRGIPLPAKPHGLRPYLLYRASRISSPNPSPRNLTSAAAVGSEGEGIAAARPQTLPPSLEPHHAIRS